MINKHISALESSINMEVQQCNRAGFSPAVLAENDAFLTTKKHHTKEKKNFNTYFNWDPLHARLMSVNS